MVPISFSFQAKLFFYHGDKASWIFVKLPMVVADGIRFFTTENATKRRGFGSVKVSVSIGDTSWKTSVFPDKQSGSYLLPIKADVRKAEGISVGDVVEINLSLADEIL